MAMASGVMTNVMPVGRFIHGGLNHDEPWDFSWDLMGFNGIEMGFKWDFSWDLPSGHLTYSY